MKTDSPLKIHPLDKYGITMKKEEVAEALGVGLHVIAPLTRAGLLEPLGYPHGLLLTLIRAQCWRNGWRIWPGWTRWSRPSTGIGALRTRKRAKRAGNPPATASQTVST